MLYLLDANILIRAHAEYYPIDRVPEFWDWIEHHGHAGSLKIPAEIYEEIEAGGGDRERDLLLDFVKRAEVKRALIFRETINPDLVHQVCDRGYGQHLTALELERIGRDPFLVAYALADPAARTVITAEVSSPAKQRANRKVPDVCRDVGVAVLGPFAFYRALGFSTNWRAGA